MKLYLAVTPDEYELPLAVERDPQSLGQIFGVQGDTVLCSIANNSSGIRAGRKFIRIEVDED